MLVESTSLELPEAPASDHLLVREVDGEMLILDTVADKVHRLNPTASLIWRLSDQGAPPADIETELVTRFEVDAETVRRDVELTLETFRSLSLLRGRPA